MYNKWLAGSSIEFVFSDVLNFHIYLVSEFQIIIFHCHQRIDLFRNSESKWKQMIWSQFSCYHPYTLILACLIVNEPFLWTITLIYQYSHFIFKIFPSVDWKFEPVQECRNAVIKSGKYLKCAIIENNKNMSGQPLPAVL